MKCNEIQDQFGIYFDLPDDDPRKAEIDNHIAQCPTCREEFALWKESIELIRIAARDQSESPAPTDSTAESVMKRIYEDESWRLPVSKRIYSIPYRMRRNVTAFIALCMAIFLFSFFQAVTGSSMFGNREPVQYGFMQTARVTAESSDNWSVSIMARNPSASAVPIIMEPAKISSIAESPNYYLILSVLGMSSAILVLNWFTRIRA